MTNPKVDPIDLAEFWRFWKWQYTCRNPEYIKAYRKYDKLAYQISEIAKERTVTDIDSDEFGAFCDSCQKKYGWTPIKGPDRNSDSKKILEAVYTRKLNKNIAGFSPYKYYVDIWGLENGNIRYTIDFTKPLDQVLAEVKAIYQNNAVNQKFVSDGLVPPSAVRDEIQAELDKYFYNNSGESFRLDDVLRAIGLWLWDYVKLHNIKVRAAIRELDKIINLDRSGFGSLDVQKPNSSPESTYKRITRYYKLTDRCIEEMKVFPIHS